MYNNNLVKCVVKIQRKYKSIINKINILNYFISFHKDYLLNVLDNLTNMSNLKLYQDTDNSFTYLLNELKKIKVEIDKYPSIILYHELKSGDLNYYMEQYYKINDMFINYSNYICSENITYTFKLLLGKNWINSFVNCNLDKIAFIINFIKPISAWHSVYKYSEIINKFTTKTISEDKLIVKDNTFVKHLGNILELPSGVNSFYKTNLDTDSKNKNDIKSTIYYLAKNNNIIEDCNNILKVDNIVILKNGKAQALIEDNLGCLVYIKLESNDFIIIRGLIKNDLLNTTTEVAFIKNKLEQLKKIIVYDNSIIKSDSSTQINILDKIFTPEAKKSMSHTNLENIIEPIEQKSPITNYDLNTNIVSTQDEILESAIKHIISPQANTSVYPVEKVTKYSNIPKYFKENYLNILNLRDLVCCTNYEIAEDIYKKYNDFKLIQSKSLLLLINDFMVANKYRKIDILTLLLISNEDDQKLAFILFDIFKLKDTKNIVTELYQSLHYSIRGLLDISKNKVEKEENELIKITDSDIPYERRINLMKTSDITKTKAIEKLKLIKSNFQGDPKAQAWLDGLLKIPFGLYSQNDIIAFKDSFLKKININKQDNLFSDSDIDNYINNLRIVDHTNLLINEWDKYKLDKKKYMLEIRNTLNTAVYGHKEAKIQLERVFAQWINGESKGAILGLQGPPGTGKTSLAKHGLSKCLKDQYGNSRPFAFLPVGGSTNGSTLVGHNFTYIGSTWGKIVDILMTTNCMNPIIFIDELDKVSQTEHGREIISILTHLTDSTQNDEFEDKFFAGIKLDLSKALIIFSFNDASLIDPILKDRITIIETSPFTLNEKITIINDYILPEICKEVGFNKHEIIMSNKIIKFIIESYTNEAGVRKIKEKIFEIIRDINLNRFYSDDYNIPFIVTEDYVIKLFENKPKIKPKKIHNEPTVGLVNGLYATTSGIGGLTPIQVVKYPSNKMLDLELTGKAGEVMKESVQYALKIAWILLTKEEQDTILNDANNKKTFGIHIHCPDAATPKDGPSAGAAFTLAIYSLLTNKKINNKICMTGEIDMLGNITAIGGVSAKLLGGKNAGCELALIPEENLEDLEILRKNNSSPEDNNFKVVTIKHIKQVLEYAIY